MTGDRPRNPRRSGFTLIELLTVVAIISLLIGILLPSLARARDQAKKAKVAGMLSSIDKALEMFHNDFGQYPDSRYRADPITDWVDPDGSDPLIKPPDNKEITGAHWLARALVGHDTRGPDAKGLGMGQSGVPFNDLKAVDRRGPYMEGEIYARDDDKDKFPGPDMPGGLTGRLLLVEDSFKSPVLYYRANPMAREPFCLDGDGTAEIGHPHDKAGIYRQNDNGRITGSANLGDGWDFANTGLSPAHRLKLFGYDPEASADDIHNDESFANFLHNHAAHKASGIAKPHNPDRFILITAGKDGVLGSSDDITNFSSGL